MSGGLTDAILANAETAILPWEENGRVLSLDAVAALTKEHSLPGHIIEAEALKVDVYPSRYVRNMTSITRDDQIRLLHAKVGQVGLGGLGGNLLEMLLRVGIGTIKGADGDDFEASNLNRQMLSTPTNLDRPKGDAAEKRAARINPSVTFSGSNEFLTKETLPHFLEGCDLAIDALGGLKTRLHLQHAAANANIPLITGALAGWTGYVGVVMPGQIGPADIMGHDNAAEETLGCPSPAVTCFASLMATEVVKVLTGQPDSLVGKMLIVDLAASSFETITL